MVDLVELFLAPLEAAGVDYMVSGSVAATLYGEPRVTLDVDVALAVVVADAPRFVAAFPEPAYYCPPLEVLVVELGRVNRGHFNILHVESGLKADFYPSREHPLFEWALAHRRVVTVGKHAVPLAPPEYVILWKLAFHHEAGDRKHLRDIAAMLAVSAAAIDSAFVAAEAEKLGLGASWRQVRR